MEDCMFVCNNADLVIVIKQLVDLETRFIMQYFPVILFSSGMFC